jgi:hypothetical protein
MPWFTNISVNRNSVNEEKKIDFKSNTLKETSYALFIFSVCCGELSTLLETVKPFRRTLVNLYSACI